MKILVTGGAGFIGTNLIKRLLKDGYDVTSDDNYITGSKKNHQKGCRYINIDLTSSWGTWYEEMDVIFHLGALARIQPSFKRPVATLKNNINSTINVLDYARKRGSQIIYAGSSSKHYNEYRSPYAWSKSCGEDLCKLYSRIYDLNTIICRFYNVYGDYMISRGEYSTVIGVFQTQYRNKFPLTIVGDGEQRRDFTHVDDIVGGLVGCIGKDYRAEDFELGSGKNYSINEVANMFDCDVKHIPERKGEYQTTLCNYSKAKKHLNYEPNGNLEEYIKNWLKKNGKGE